MPWIPRPLLLPSELLPRLAPRPLRRAARRLRRAARRLRRAVRRRWIAAFLVPNVRPRPQNLQCVAPRKNRVPPVLPVLPSLSPPRSAPQWHDVALLLLPEPFAPPPQPTREPAAVRTWPASEPAGFVPSRRADASAWPRPSLPLRCVGHLGIAPATDQMLCGVAEPLWILHRLLPRTVDGAHGPRMPARLHFQVAGV